MVKHQPRAALVIPIHIIDTVTFKEKNNDFFSAVCVASKRLGELVF